MFSTKGVKIYDICLTNPPSSLWTSGLKFQMIVRHGNETKTSTKRKAKQGDLNSKDGHHYILWNESFTFSGDATDDSPVTFTAIRLIRRIAKTTIGSSEQLRVADLLEIRNNSEGSCRLNIGAGKCYLTFSIEKLSDILPEVVGEASSGVLSTHLNSNRKVLNGALDSIVISSSAVQFCDDQVETWASFLLQFQAFMKVMDDILVVSLYVKIAWDILSAIPKTIIIKMNRDERVKRLYEKMKDIYDHVTDAKRLPELTKTQLKTLTVLVQQTIECAYFIRAYNAGNTVKIMVKGAIIDDKIQRFNDKFDHLKQVMMDSVHLETSIVTLRVSEGITELNDLTLLEGIPYDPDAGFIPGKRCFPGTRQTLISEILDWVNSDAPQILVLSGQAGTGKSAVAHTIAGLFREQNRLGSMFCFNRSYKDRRKSFFSTMARDLADGDVMWRKELVKVIQKAADRKSKDPQIQFEELIVKPSQNVSTIGSVVIVVDALDESGDRGERREILELLFDRCSELPKNYRILVTSRPEQDIELYCQKPGPAGNVSCIRMEDANSEETHSDILTYISGFLAPISPTLDMIDQDWCGILAKRAECLFQWARTACEFIDPAITRPQLIHKKWETCISVSSSLSSPLYGLYHQIISSQSEINSKDADFVNDFKTVVGAIIMAREPLPINVLQSIFSDIEDIKSILSPFGSLFTGVHDLSTPVRPLHTSLFDFFTAAENHEYYIDTSDESIMTISCLRLMNRTLRFNICHLETSHRFNRDVPNLDLRVRDAVPQHLKYSCHFWAFHLQYSFCHGERGRGELVAEIRYFMDHNLLYWFEVLSLLGTVGQGCVAMQMLKNWCTDADNDLAMDAMDAWDFGYDFEEVMMDSTPHIYLSALPFAPCNSFVSKTYLAAYPGLFTFDNDSGEPPSTGVCSFPKTGVTRRHTNGYPNSLAFHPNSKYIASGSDYGEFWMWDYTTGELVHAYYNNGPGSHGASGSVGGAPICDIVFSSLDGGDSVYCCFASGDILLFNTRTNEKYIESYAVMMPVSGDRQCHSCTISSDGCFILLCMENEAFLYDRASRLVIKRFDSGLSTSWIRCPGFSPNGVLSVLVMNNQLCISNTRQLNAEGTIILGAHVNGTVALSDSYVAFVENSGLEIWDVRIRSKVTEIRFELNTTEVSSMVFSPESQYLLSASQCGYCIWNVSTGELITRSIVDHHDTIYCLAFSHDSKLIALGNTWDGSINVRQWAATNIDNEPSTQPSPELSVELPHNPIMGDNGTVLGIGLRDTYLILVYRRVYLQNHKYFIRISDITTMNTVLYEAELTHWRLVALCPDTGNSKLKEPSDSDAVHVAYITSGGFLCTWDETTKSEITVDESAHSATALASSNKYIVWAAIADDGNSPNGEGYIKIWDIRTRELMTGGSHTTSGRVEKLCISKSSIKFIVAYNGDNRIEVRQCKTGRIIGGPFKLESYPCIVTFSPDETRIICIRHQGAEIINTATGKSVDWALRMYDSVSPLSPDGKYIAGMDEHGEVKLFDTDSEISLLDMNFPSALFRRTVHELEFSNDSKQVIILTSDAIDSSDNSQTAHLEVAVWDIQSASMILNIPLNGFRSDIFHLILTDGYLVIATYDCVEVLDMNAYEMISTLYDTHCNHMAHPVAIERKWFEFTSRTVEVLDYAMIPWKKASAPAFSVPNKHDGWILGSKNELLLWIPQKKRMGFWSPLTVHMPYRNITKLNFNNFVHGATWTACKKCY